MTAKKKKPVMWKPQAPDLDGGVGPHRHRWRTTGWLGDIGVTFNCTVKKDGKRCRAGFEREMTPAEKKIFSDKPENDVHVVFHEFVRLFRDKDTAEWRYQGYDLMTRIQRWAPKHPNDVTIVGVDDDHHSSSYLVIIDHKTKRRYMGLTCINIPQLGGPPSEFFLYPEARDSLIQALKAFAGPARKAAKAEEKDRVAKSKAWDKIVTLPPSKYVEGKATSD